MRRRWAGEGKEKCVGSIRHRRPPSDIISWRVGSYVSLFRFVHVFPPPRFNAQSVP